VSAILDEMAEVRRIVSLALEARAKAVIKVRQPLALITISHESTWKGDMRTQLEAIIKDEVNVKEIVWGGKGEQEVMLDIVITKELKEEGELRDVIRLVQDMRKKQELNPADRIVLTVPKDKLAFVEKYHAEFTGTTGVDRVQGGDGFAVEKV
jgi:isoleucyl-tRNA synthetase